MTDVWALLVSAFFMGLFGGAHCVTMCGGVVSVLCSATPRALPRKTLYVLAYNAGRIAGYVSLGAAFGAIGSLSSGIFPLGGVRLALRGFAAVLMLAVGLHLAGFPSLVRSVEALGAPLWRRIRPLAERLLPIRSPLRAVVVGMLWGLLPCGLLYGALAIATSSGSAIGGGATMLAFGAGTLPVMLTMGAIAESVAVFARRPLVRRIAGAVVLAFGLWASVGVASQIRLGTLGGPCCPRSIRASAALLIRRLARVHPPPDRVVRERGGVPERLGDPLDVLFEHGGPSWAQGALVCESDDLPSQNLVDGFTKESVAFFGQRHLLRAAVDARTESRDDAELLESAHHSTHGGGRDAERAAKVRLRRRVVHSLAKLPSRVDDEKEIEPRRCQSEPA
jgi:uncharacterized protein